MKIVHILSTNKLSGAEKVAINIIQNSSFSQNFYCSPSGEIDKVLENLSINQVVLPKFDLVNVLRSSAKLKPDLIHAHDFKSSLFSIFTNNSKVISHIHQNPTWLNNKKNIKSLIYKYFSNKFFKIVCVSESVKSQMINLGISEDKIEVLKNQIDIKLLKKPLISMSEKKYDLIFVGRNSNEKNPIGFVDICKQIRSKGLNIKALMIGTGELDSEVKKYINDLKLTQEITFLGFKEDPYQYMLLSKIFCVTSTYEGFGLAAAEAQALGVPLVSTNVGGINEFANSKSSVIAPIEEHADIIIKLLRDENLLEEMSTNARSALVDYTSLNNLEVQLELLYS